LRRVAEIKTILKLAKTWMVEQDRLLAALGQGLLLKILTILKEQGSKKRYIVAIRNETLKQVHSKCEKWPREIRRNIIKWLQ